MNRNQPHYFEFGEFRLDTIERVLFCNGAKVSLTHKAYQLLLTLVENKGHLLQHKELMDLVWQETAVDQSSLKQNIALLRKALGDTTDEPKFIQTMPKYGYRFIAPVKISPNENIALITERRTVTQIDILEEFPVQTKQLNGNNSYSFSRLMPWFILIFVALGLTVFATVYFQRNIPHQLNSNIFAVKNIIPNKITDKGNIERGVLSPNGEFIVFNTFNPETGFALWVRRVEGKDEIQLVAPSLTERAEAFTVTNDGNWVYYVSTNGGWGRQATLNRVSIMGGKPHKITEYLDGFVSFSPNDKLMVFNRFTTQGCQLVIANAWDGSSERVIAQGKNNSEFLDPKWSPDGKQILFYNIDRNPGGTLWSLSTISVENRQITNILAPNPQRIWFLAWAKDGNIVINASDLATSLPQIYSVSYPEGKIERTTNDLFNYIGASVGGNSIVSTKYDRRTDLWISDAEHLNLPPRKITSGYFDSFEWTNDGRIVFAATNNGKCHIWKMNADGTNKEQISPDEFDELLPDVSPDNRLMTFISNRGGTYEIWVSELDGGHPKQLTFGNPRVWHPRFAADNASVFFEMTKNETSVLANIKIDGSQLREIVSDVSIIFYDIAPDGKSIAYSFEDKEKAQVRVAIRSLETGEVTKLFDIAPARFLRFSPDGAALVFKQSEQNAPVSSVWIQPIDGGQSRQLVDFKQDEVFWLDYSPDKKHIANISGKSSADLILLKSALGKE